MVVQSGLITSRHAKPLWGRLADRRWNVSALDYQAVQRDEIKVKAEAGDASAETRKKRQGSDILF
jgi:hypothetical protein